MLLQQAGGENIVVLLSLNSTPGLNRRSGIATAGREAGRQHCPCPQALRMSGVVIFLHQIPQTLRALDARLRNVDQLGARPVKVLS